MWEAMVNYLPKGRHRIIGGDWNMVEMEEDRSTKNNIMFMGRQERAWEQIKIVFGIQDFFDYTSETFYTWDNGRLNEHRILYGLDSIYTYTSPNESSPCREYINIGGAIGSEHIPIHFSIKVEGVQPHDSIYKMSSQFLKDLEVIQAITRIWNEECTGNPSSFKFCQMNSKIL